MFALGVRLCVCVSMCLSVCVYVIPTHQPSQARDPGALPPPSTWLAVTGVAFGLVSTFFSWTYRQAATALRNFVGNVEPRDVVKRLELGAQLNLLGMGASILALQAEVGSLLTKTLTSSAANPYAARATQAPVAFDVFTVQVGRGYCFYSAEFVNTGFYTAVWRVQLTPHCLCCMHMVVSQPHHALYPQPFHHPTTFHHPHHRHLPIL